jgi:hypothetical protein
MMMSRIHLLSDAGLRAWLRRCGEESRRAVTEGQTPHLTTDEVIGYVERTLPLEQRAELMEHVVGCPACSERVNAAVRERVWAVTLVTDGSLLLEVRTAERTWQRISESSVDIEARTGERLIALSDAFIARRQQGNWDVVIRAASGDRDGLSVSVCLLSSDGHVPVPNVPLRLEQEKGWDYVLMSEAATNEDGFAAFAIPLGEFALRIPSSPILSVLVSVISPKDLEENDEEGNQFI